MNIHYKTQKSIPQQMLASCNASDDFSIPNKTGNNPNFLLKMHRLGTFGGHPLQPISFWEGWGVTGSRTQTTLTPSPVDCKEVRLELSLNTEQPRNASGQTNGHLSITDWIIYQLSLHPGMRLRRKETEITWDKFNPGLVVKLLTVPEGTWQ